MRKYKFKNYSSKEVILRYKNGDVVRITPGEDITTRDENIARRYREIPEFCDNYQKLEGYEVARKKRQPMSLTDKDFHRKLKLQTRNYFKQQIKPEVSIIILNKDCPEVIKPCINSIIEKVMYPECKIVIGDTGTTNKETLDFYGKIQKEYANITVINGLKYHFGKNYNELIRKETADHVLMLNNDTVALNDFVSEMAKYVQNNKVGAVGAKLLYPDGTIQHVGQCLYDGEGNATNGPGHYYLKEDPNKIKSKSHCYVDGVTAACMLMNRDLFLSIGGFDESYKDIFQDVDLNMKIRSKGYKIFQCNDAQLTHHDNYSRKKVKGGISPKEVWGDTARYTKKWISKGNPPISEKFIKKPKISFLTPVTSQKTYMSFIKSVDLCDNLIEFICVRNLPEQAGLTSPEVLNVLNDLAEGEIVIMCHEDIVLSPGWINSVLKYIEKIEKKDKNWGLLGPVGIGYQDDTTRGISFLLHDPNYWLRHHKDDLVKCSGVLDEVCIISKRNACKFDENLDGYHFYGADLSMTLTKNKKSLWVANIPIRHLSIDGSKNLKKREQWDEYRRLAKKLILKWKERDFVTTTIVVKGGQVLYWLAKRLGFDETERIF